MSKRQTRAEVRKFFGTPTHSGTADGHDFDVYWTHRKIDDQTSETAGMGMSFAMTFGLGEFIMFPQQVFKVVRNTIRGQEVRYVYDDKGNVIYATLHGSKCPCHEWDKISMAQPSPAPDRQKDEPVK